AGLSGPRFEPVEPVPLYGCGVVAEGRLQKYFGSLNGCPMRLDPIALPLRTIRLPPAWVGKRTWPIPVTTSGHTIPVMAIRRRKRTTAGRTIEFMSGLPSDEVREHQCEIDQLDTQEGDDDSPQSVDQKVAPQQHRRSERAVLDALQSEWDQYDDDERVEDYRR